jgi:hypothetical protein
VLPKKTAGAPALCHAGNKKRDKTIKSPCILHTEAFNEEGKFKSFGKAFPGYTSENWHYF